MNDQRSQSISDEDLSGSFILSWRQLYKFVENDDAEQAMVSAQTLQTAFDRLLQSADPVAPYQVRSSLTEIHRLLRILNRDLMFWQGAKQTRAGRGTQVLATLQSIEGFYQVLVSDPPKKGGGQSDHPLF
jgi:hypothetical protein